jgi:hypothetical protein
MKRIIALIIISLPFFALGQVKQEILLNKYYGADSSGVVMSNDTQKVRMTIDPSGNLKFWDKFNGYKTLTALSSGALWTRDATNKALYPTTSGDGLLIAGTTGTVSATGAGTRLMYIPNKKSLIFGTVSGGAWNSINQSFSLIVGEDINLAYTPSYSIAVGTNHEIGQYSAAFGNYVSARSSYTFACGSGTKSQGNYAFSGGQDCSAMEINAFAMGHTTTATGKSAFAMNHFTTAQSYASTVIGRYNIVRGTTGSWVATEDLFVVGNGTGTGANSSNAFVVYKNAVIEQDSLKTFATSSIIADDGTITPPTAISGWGWVRAYSSGNLSEAAYQFEFNSDGAVTLVNNTTNVASADTDGKLCIFDNGTGIIIKNRLGSSQTLKVELKY